jgi:hypothetical protein
MLIAKMAKFYIGTHDEFDYFPKSYSLQRETCEIIDILWVFVIVIKSISTSSFIKMFYCFISVFILSFYGGRRGGYFPQHIFHNIFFFTRKTNGIYFLTVVWKHIIFWMYWLLNKKELPYFCYEEMIYRNYGEMCQVNGQSVNASSVLIRAFCRLLWDEIIHFYLFVSFSLLISDRMSYAQIKK